MSRTSKGRQTRRYFVNVQGEAEAVQITMDEGQAQVAVNGDSFSIAGAYRPGAAVQEFMVNGAPMRFRVTHNGESLTLARHGIEITTRAWSQLEHDLYEVMPEKEVADTSNQVLSPMPGKVLAIRVAAGQRVEPGEELCVIEAMKMENVLVAERAAVVDEILVAEGDTVNADQLLLLFGTDAG